MSFFLRNSFAHSTPARQEALRKSEQQRAQRDIRPLDGLSTSVGPDRGPLADAREVMLAKMEAEEARKEAVLKHEADLAARLGKNYTLRDNPQPRPVHANETVTSVQTRHQAFNKADNASNTAAKPGSDASVSASTDSALDDVSKACAGLKSDLQRVAKSMADVVAEHQALMAKINGQDDDDDADDDGADPTTGPVRDTKVKPGTSNVTHTPNPDGVYAKQDRRTVTSTHHVNRKAKGVPVAKSEHVYGGGSVRLVNAAGVDLASLFQGVQLKPA